MAEEEETVVVVVVAVEVVEEETVTSEWRNAGWEAGVEEEDSDHGDSPAEDVVLAAAIQQLIPSISAESRYHQVLI